jgi:hypothetical protein
MSILKKLTGLFKSSATPTTRFKSKLKLKTRALIKGAREAPRGVEHASNRKFFAQTVKTHRKLLRLGEKTEQGKRKVTKAHNLGYIRMKAGVRKVIRRGSK